MENYNTNLSRPKRLRLNPIRKWLASEERLLVEFLMENRQFEKPTAQSYYRRFCSEKNVTMDWQQVRAKVRNMRVNYNKAKTWENSTGVGNMDGSAIKSTLTKMCTYFDELDDIFSSRNVESTIVDDSFDSVNEMPLNSIENINDESTATESQEQIPSTSKKGIYSRTAVSEMIQMQTEIIEIKKQKMNFDKDLKEREVLVMEKNIELKEKELQLREKEINNQRELKILELNMKERIAMEELRLKYSK